MPLSNDMMKSYGPVILVEDDPDDRELFTEALRKCDSSINIYTFENGAELFDYLCTTEEQPFLIICDINLPKMDGITVRTKIQSEEYLRKKSIPFVFLSTDANQIIVDRAYELTVQGFFKKPAVYEQILKLMSSLIQYWKACRHPNN